MKAFFGMLLLCLFSDFALSGDVIDDPRLYQKNKWRFRETILYVEKIDFNHDGVADYFISSNESDSTNGRALRYWNVFLSKNDGFSVPPFNVATASLEFYKNQNKILLRAIQPDGVEGSSEVIYFFEEGEMKKESNYIDNPLYSNGPSKSLIDDQYSGFDRVESEKSDVPLVDLLGDGATESLPSRLDYVFNKYVFIGGDEELSKLGWERLALQGIRESEGLQGFYSGNYMFIKFPEEGVISIYNAAKKNILENDGSFVPAGKADYELIKPNPFIEGWPKDYGLKEDPDLSAYKWRKVYSKSTGKLVGLIGFDHAVLIERSENIDDKALEKIRHNIIENDGVYKPWLMKNNVENLTISTEKKPLDNDKSGKSKAAVSEQIDQQKAKSGTESVNQDIVQAYPERLAYWLFGGAFLMFVVLLIVKLRSKQGAHHEG